MRSFDITVPGDPLSKARPRVYQGHGVTDRRTRNAESRVYSEFRRKYADAEPIQGPVRIRLEFWMASRHPRDWDNLAKLATDALNGVAWTDDVQIVDARTLKYLPDQKVPGARPGTMRNRRPGDPPRFHGEPYEPHTDIHITEIIDPLNRKTSQ